MSITIGRIANKFWNNSGWEMPNGFPIYEEQKELKFDTPNMNDFMSGTIYLEGDSWNHCKYEGAYYSLHIVHLVSHRKRKYLYRLERDMGMDILIHRPKVIGDLSNSNNDELLEANLNRTISALDNPARIITVNFGNVEFDWTKNFVFKESRKEMKQFVLSKDSFAQFVAAMQGRWIKDGKEVNEEAYSSTKCQLKDGTNEATFIFAYLRSSFTSQGWKHILREKINEFVRSIETDKGNQLKLSKVNSESFKQSKLNGNYCITHKVDGISTTAENVSLREIDLSRLVDIVPINIHDLNEIEPYTPIGEGTKSGLFDVIESQPHKFPFLAKIRRKAYIPINASEDKTPEIPEGFGSFRERDFNGTEAKDPQIVKWAFEGKQGQFNLWFLDNVNFMTTYDYWNPTFYYDEARAGVSLIASAGFAAGKLLIASDYNAALDRFKANSYFDSPVPWISAYPTFENLKDPIVPFGFLIYGLQRRYGEWKRYEYIGNDTKKKVHYYSGIKNGLLKKYSEDGEWWSKINDELSKIQPTEQFTKFYLDNYHFNGLCFFPSTKYNKGSDPYLYSDGGGTYKHTPDTYYVQYILNRDLHDINGVNRKANPYNDERYPAERARIDNNLVSYLNRSVIDLPDNLSIEKGDYFFSDQDYEILEYPTSIENERLKIVSQGKHIGARIERLFPYSFLVEDMMEIKGGKLFAVRPDEKMVVLCTTNSGGMEIRTLETFERELRISASEDEIVQEVDGNRNRITRFTLIKKVLGDIVDINFKEITDKHREQIIHAFYRVNGYKTKIIGGVAHGTGFNEADFSPKSNLQQLFDLVGTDGYAFIAKGKISLICKKTNLFAPQKGQSGRLLHEENKDLNLSLIEKINQKVRFQFFSVPYYLNGKSTFSNRDKINFSVETIQPTELQTNFDQYFIKLDTAFDAVYYENVSLAKKQTKALSPADTVQLEKLNLDFVKAQYSYQIDADRYKIATDRFQERIRQAEIDLQHQRIQSFLNLGAAGTAGLFGTGVAMKYRKGAKTVTTLEKGVAVNPHVSLGFAPGMGDSYSLIDDKSGYMPFQFMPTENKKITKIAGKTPNIMAGVVAASIFKTSKIIMDHAFRFPEMERRIGVEKQIGAAELALQSLALDTKFVEKQINTQLAINQKTNIYSNPIINEREIMESFMDKDEWHGKKLKPAHLICFVPSEEQLVALRSFKEEYGVMCDIPDIETNFYEGMPPDVIRYRNLDDDAITGLPNEWMRAFLHAHLLAGIKIVKTTGETYQLLSQNDYRDKIFRLNVDLLEKANEIDTKDKQIQVLSGQVNTIADSVREECAQKESELQKRIREVEDQVNNVNEQLRKKIEELEKLKNDCDNSKKELEDKKRQLEDEIHKHKVDKEELEQKLADERRRAINEKDEINKLKKELEEAKKGKPTGKGIDDVDCQLMINVMSYPYHFDPKSRENGGDGFLDLIFELATAMRGEGRSHIDQKLLNVAEIRPLIEKLEELKNIPVVDKAIDIMNEAGGAKYKEWLESGGNKNGDVDKVIEKMNEIKLMSNDPNMHSVKAILDELNFLVHKAKAALGNRVNTDHDIESFLGHIYPGRANELYKEIFGDPKMALIRKLYAENVRCVADSKETTLSIIKDYERSINLDKVFVPRPSTPVTPAEPGSGTGTGTSEEVAPPRRDDIRGPGFARGKYAGSSDYTDNEIETYIRPAVGGYESAKKEGGRGRGTVDSTVPVAGGSFRQETLGLVIVMWNYPYYKSIPGASSGWDKNKKVVGWRKNWSSESGGYQDTYSQYFEAIYYPGTDKFKEVWRNRSKIIIPPELLKTLVEGDKKIEVRFKNIETDGYDVKTSAQMVEFEEDKWEIPDDKIEDFIKLLFILHAFRLSPGVPGTVPSDGYTVYAFKGGGETEEYLKYGRGKEDRTVKGQLQDVYYRINKAIASIKDKRIQLDLGGLFSSNYKYDSTKFVREGKFRDMGVMLHLNRYFFGVLDPKNQNKHPGDLGRGQMDNLFKELDEVRRSS